VKPVTSVCRYAEGSVVMGGGCGLWGALQQLDLGTLERQQ
jgi:hypothetical protein